MFRESSHTNLTLKGAYCVCAKYFKDNIYLPCLMHIFKGFQYLIKC